MLGITTRGLVGFKCIVIPIVLFCYGYITLYRMYHRLILLTYGSAPSPGGKHSMIYL